MRIQRSYVVHSCFWDIIGTAILEKIIDSCIKNTKYETIIQPNNCILDIYPREMSTYVHTKNCTQMFITVLFIIA